MKLNKGLKAFFQETIKGDSYWVEKAKLDFALGLERQRRHAELTYASIAQKLGTSAAYITKVFRGESNLTIESMVKLARAAGGELELQVVEKRDSRFHWDARSIPANARANKNVTTSATVVSLATYAANHSRFDPALFKEAA